MLLIDLKCERCGHIVRDARAEDEGWQCAMPRAGGFIGTKLLPPPCGGIMQRMWSDTRVPAVPASGTYSYGAR